MYEICAKGREVMEQKRKEEIRKSIIACDNDIVKLRSQAENLEEIMKKIKSARKNVLRVNAISMKSKGRKKR